MRLWRGASQRSHSSIGRDVFPPVTVSQGSVDVVCAVTSEEGDTRECCSLLAQALSVRLEVLLVACTLTTTASDWNDNSTLLWRASGRFRYPSAPLQRCRSCKANGYPSEPTQAVQCKPNLSLPSVPLTLPSFKESYRDMSASYLRAPGHLTMHLTPQQRGLCCAGKQSACLLAVLFNDNRFAPVQTLGRRFRILDFAHSTDTSAPGGQTGWIGGLTCLL